MYGCNLVVCVKMLKHEFVTTVFSVFFFSCLLQGATRDRGAVSDTSSSTSDFSGCSFFGGGLLLLKSADIFVVCYNSSREDHEDHSLLQEQRSLAAVMFLEEGFLLVVSSSPSQPWCSLQVSSLGSGTSKRNHQETLWLRRSMWPRLDPLRDSVSSL